MLLTKRDVAARLGMSVRSVERHVCSELGGFIGSRWLVSQEDFDAWLAKRLHRGASTPEAFDLFALEGEEADS